MIAGRKGDTVVDRDEHIRPDSSVETLAKLRPIMGRDDPEATVTAGNASGQNDGAAIAIVTHPEKAAELGLRPLARLVSWGVAGVPPKTMGIGPVPATAKALAQADLKLADVDLIELNEAFASQVLAVTREWGFTDSDFERTNVNGSGISLGHPVGATGGRILATLLREMDRREARYGLETMCIGGGQGLAALFERVSCEWLVSRRVAIVTGAARGIGAATALRLAADGFAVAVIDLKESDAQDTVTAIEAAGGRALAVGADVGDAEQVQAAVDRVAAELGPPVVLVNNAGVTRDNLLFKMTDAGLGPRHARAPAGLVPHDPRRAEAHDRGDSGAGSSTCRAPRRWATAARPTTPPRRRACRASPRPSPSSWASSASRPTRSPRGSSSPT